jgi:HTH-type transcriptional repressor of NAD biosynthesis genes
MRSELRQTWLQDTFAEFAERQQIRIVRFDYNENDLPNSSESSRTIAAVWSAAIVRLGLGCDVVISGEPYGEYVAENMAIAHVFVDRTTLGNGISATLIRQNPLLHWAQIPLAVRPYFVVKICVCGSESTGKSTLVAQLAAHYNTEYVAEAGRELVEKTENCTFTDLENIVLTHTARIIAQSKTANGLLFLDTDCFTTASYAQFLFQKQLPLTASVLAANAAKLYLYLNTDAPFVQDGTRLPLEERNKLDESHRKIYAENKVVLHEITGDVEGRFAQAVLIIKDWLLGN